MPLYLNEIAFQLLIEMRDSCSESCSLNPKTGLATGEEPQRRDFGFGASLFQKGTSSSWRDRGMFRSKSGGKESRPPLQRPSQ